MPQVKCPHCGLSYDIPAQSWPQYAGRSISCTRCGQAFAVGGTAAPAARAGAPQYAPPPQGQGSPYAGGAALVPRKPNPFAIWAVVLGALSFFLSAIAGLPAIVLGVLGIRRSAADPQVGGKGVAIAGLALGIGGTLFSLLILSIVGPAWSRARYAQRRAECAASMRQIGMGLMMYSTANNGRYPDTLDALVKAGYLQQPVRGCPIHEAQPRGPAAGATPPGYVYVGKGMIAGRIKRAASTVLMYEQPAHDGAVNVLYADAHVELVPKESAPRLIADLQKGVNPPSVTVTGGR